MGHKRKKGGEALAKKIGQKRGADKWKFQKIIQILSIKRAAIYSGVGRYRLIFSDMIWLSCNCRL